MTVTRRQPETSLPQYAQREEFEMKNTEWMTVSEAAKLIAMTPNTIRSYVHRFGLPAIVLPTGTIRIRREDFEVWLQTRHNHTLAAV
jgi:excisionase family DNA binding protein